MEPESFTRPLGRVDLGGTGYYNFVPDPIPSAVDYTGRVVEKLSGADRQLGRLSSYGQLLPDAEQFIFPYLVREAVLSSKIEGTQATASDIFLRDAIAAEYLAPGPLRVAADVREVQNYIEAQRAGWKAVRSRPIDLELIKDLHRRLLRGVRGEEKSPGEFRTLQNWIGPPGTPIDLARYVPPEPRAMNRCLEDLSKYFASPPSVPPLIQAALVHYQFESIHPFRDGNGRIGRLLVSLILLQRGVLTTPLLYLSAYLERNRRRYYDLLLAVSQRSALEEWLVFFLEGVASESNDAVVRAEKLIAMRERYRRKLEEIGARANAFSVMEKLFVNPYTTAPNVADTYGVTFPTAQKILEQLEGEGIIKEVTGRLRNRVYLATQVLSAMDRQMKTESGPPSA